MVRIRTDFVPKASAHLITPGKVYEVRNPAGWLMGGYITSDNGYEMCVYLPADAYLDNKPWEVLKEPEEGGPAVIDPYKPLELSNGTPVTLVSVEDGSFFVKIPAGKPYKFCHPSLENAISFYYDTAGNFIGFENDPDYFTLRNKESEE